MISSPDLGLPYQAYVPPPDEIFSEDEWDAPEPVRVACPRDEPTPGGDRPPLGVVVLLPEAKDGWMSP